MRIKLIIVIFIILVLTALTPLALFAFMSNRTSQAVLIDSANQSLFLSATQTAITIDNFVENNLINISAEAQLPTFVTYLSLSEIERSDSQEAEVVSTFQALSRTDETFILSYALLDNHGINIADTYSSDIGQDESENSYFKEPLQTDLPYNSPVEFTKTSNEANLYFASPVHNTAGEIIGVLRVRYDAEILQQLIVSSDRMAGVTSFAALYDENHMCLAHSIVPEVIYKFVVLPTPEKLATLQSVNRLPELPPEELSMDLPKFEQQLAEIDLSPVFITEDFTIGEMANQVVVRNLKTQPWLVAYFQLQDEIQAPTKAVTRSTFLLVIMHSILVIPVALIGAVVVVKLAQKNNSQT